MFEKGQPIYVYADDWWQRSVCNYVDASPNFPIHAHYTVVIHDKRCRWFKTEDVRPRDPAKNGADKPKDA